MLIKLTGREYASIGQIEDSGIKLKKVFLSFSQKDGFQIVKLSLIQVFLRNVFGFYPSTHFKTIFKAWKSLSQFQISDQPLENLIQIIWMKKNLIIFGNTKPEEAEIFCFAEKHTSTFFRRIIAKLIHDYEDETSQILVEGIKVNETIEVQKHPQTSFLKKSLPIFGWEPNDIEEKDPQALTNLNKNMARVHQLAQKIKQLLPKDDSFNSQELLSLEQALPFFIKEYRDLSAIFSINCKNIEKIINNAFKKLQTKTLSKTNEHILMFWGIILTLLSRLERNQEEVFYSKMTNDDINQILTTFKKRTKSLTQEIHKRIKENHKIFAIGGAAHFLRFPYPFKKEDTLEIKKQLFQHKFVIFLKRPNFLKAFIIKFLNKDLKIFPYNVIFDERMNSY